MNALPRSNEATEADRAITAAMTELASMIGDVDSEIRRLARRIAPAIPGGSPFDVEQVATQSLGSKAGTPAPCQSHITEELQARIAQLRGMAHSLNGMTDRIEL